MKRLLLIAFCLALLLGLTLYWIDTSASASTGWSKQGESVANGKNTECSKECSAEKCQNKCGDKCECGCECGEVCKCTNCKEQCQDKCKCSEKCNGQECQGCKGRK